MGVKENGKYNSVTKVSKKIEAEWTTAKVWKNLAVISLSSFLVLAAFDGISILQSTINHEQGMGVASQAVIYALASLAAVLLPKLVIRRFGCKTIFTIAVLAHSPYVAYNFFPHWGTVLPASVITGVATTLLWASQATYINRLSTIYCGRNVQDILSTNALFFGILGVVHTAADVCGNLISFYVLKESDDDYVSVFHNSSECGVNYCETPMSDTPTAEELEPNKRYILTGAYLLIGLTAVPLAIFAADSIEVDDVQKSSIKQDLKATLKVMVKTNQLLLLPISLYVGLAYGFYMGDVTKAYVACSWGVYQVGLVDICSSVCGCAASMLCGYLIKYTGLPVIFGAMAAINAAVLGVWLTWNPDESTYYMLFVMSGLYGSHIFVVWFQSKSFYGTLFKDEEEAAFANSCLWNNMGVIIAFAVGEYVCIVVKLYALVGLFCISYIGYAAVEYRTRRSKQRNVYI